MNRFEDAVHTARREEGELSMEKLEELWLESQTKLFGDSVDVDGYGTWWSYVSHFMGSPGYVYAYAYGFLFALSIFRKYELEGDSMVEPYLDVLRAGGSKPPEELAEIVGLDLTDPRSGTAGSTRSRSSSTRPRRSPPRSACSASHNRNARTSGSRASGRGVAALRSRLTGRIGGIQGGSRCESSSRAGSSWCGACAHGARGARRRRPDTWRNSQDDHDRRDVPAHRAGGVVCADPARHEGVFQLHQRRGGRPDLAKRGVMGRQIICKFYDDGYNPANTAQLTRRLVEQDKVFATVGRSGPSRNSRFASYLNEQKVPQALVSTGATEAARSTVSSRGRSAGSPTTSPKVVSTASTSRRTRRQEDRASSTRTTTTARTTSTGSAPRSARSTPTRTSSPRRRSSRPRRAVRRR